MHKSILGRIFPFLRSRQPLDPDQVQRILLVGSGSRQNIGRAVESMSDRFPAAHLSLLIPAGDQSTRPVAEGIAEITYRGLTTLGDLRRQAAAARYDLKVVLFTGEGHTVLKLLAYLLPARRMLVFTEGGGSFTWSFDQRLAIWNHVRWRLRGGQPFRSVPRRLVRAVLNPLLASLAFMALLLWHAGLLAQRLIGRRRSPRPPADHRDVAP